MLLSYYLSGHYISGNILYGDISSQFKVTTISIFFVQTFNVICCKFLADCKNNYDMYRRTVQINTSQKRLAYKEENETKKSILMDQNRCI